MSIRFECFGMTILKARAVDLTDIDPEAKSGCLVLQLPNSGTINLFMPYPSALEYADAMNACNDREHVLAEYKHSLSVDDWRRINRGNERINDERSDVS